MEIFPLGSMDAGEIPLNATFCMHKVREYFVSFIKNLDRKYVLPPFHRKSEVQGVQLPYIHKKLFK